MARINLLTIHYGQCYGAVMQTYATCRLLEQQGHTVCVINLISPIQKGNWKRFSYWKDCVREFQFWLFKKRYFSKLTNKAYSITDINLPSADITIVGSDQVWNRDITGVFGNTFFLDFLKGGKKIALSSSFGKEIWTEDYEYTIEINKLLSEFSNISVRESTGVKIIQEVFKLNAICLPDPTIGYGEFNNLALNDKPIHKVFTFLLLNDEDARYKAKYIADALGLRLFKQSRISSKLFNGPRCWLTYIRNADYIITDSFHGLALSLIFNKQFFVFCASEKKFTRLLSLLELLSLEDRYVKSVDDFNKRKHTLMQPIDYMRVNGLLDKERNRYKDFLSKHI